MLYWMFVQVTKEEVKLPLFAQYDPVSRKS